MGKPMDSPENISQIHKFIFLQEFSLSPVAFAALGPTAASFRVVGISRGECSFATEPGYLSICVLR